MAAAFSVEEKMLEAHVPVFRHMSENPSWLKLPEPFIMGLSHNHIGVLGHRTPTISLEHQGRPLRVHFLEEHPRTRNKAISRS